MLTAECGHTTGWKSSNIRTLMVGKRLYETSVHTNHLKLLSPEQDLI